jgi:hypothetical protein
MTLLRSSRFKRESTNPALTHWATIISLLTELWQIGNSRPIPQDLRDTNLLTPKSLSIRLQ